MRKIYFAGSIRGGRDDYELYSEIIGYLQNFGEVLTEHVGQKQITDMGETGMSEQEIYARDIAWLTSADVIVAEVTTPSLGVGFEIARATDLKKQVLCLYRIRDERRVSAMISGCPDLLLKEYKKWAEIEDTLDKFFNQI